MEVDLVVNLTLLGLATDPPQVGHGRVHKGSLGKRD